LTYTVIKTVGRRSYLYLQESFRVGKEVRTRAIYLGPVDPDTGEVKNHSPADENFIEDVRQETRDRIIIAGAPEKPPPTSSSKAIPETEGPPQGLIISIDCEHKYLKISRDSLEKDWKNNRQRLLDIGIFPAKVPKVSIEYGRRVRLYKGALSNCYVVTVPKFKGVREKLRREYRRAIALASLEALQKERPDLHMRLSLQFDPKFYETQKLLSRYIAATNDRNALIKLIMLKWFGNMPPIVGGKVKPEKLGLVEYGKRKIWQDDAASLMAEIQRYGWAKAYQVSFREMKAAEKALRIIANDPLQWGKRKSRNMRRAELRIRLNEIKQDKLKILKDVFGFV
jgi:hypothetical protein